MWILDNQTVYAADRNWIRDKTGVHHWLVAVQATFDIAVDGRLILADEQPPPPLEPQYRGDPATTSLQRDSELLAPKRATDVVVEACAHAPRGKPAPTVQVSLRVGALEKTLLVHGPRVYSRGAFGLATSAPRPFTTQPIHYEGAFGGTDTSHPDPGRHQIDARNPIGKGFAVDTARLEGQLAHVVEYPNTNAAKAGPAGFGPIASFWSPRRERAGTYDADWERSHKPLLPEDYDERFALSAPDDQRPASPLRGGELISIVNMTPEGVLSFDLPKIFLTFRTRVAGRNEEHRATIATVFIAAEERKLSVVWHSTLKVRSPHVEHLESTAIAEKPYVS